MTPAAVAVLLIVLSPCGASNTNDGDDDLARLRKAENRRRQLLASLEPAVCSVMSLKAQGGGSGVIFSPRGWILTNYHVTGRNKVMKIGLPDGKFYLSDVIGVDPGGDIAVCALRKRGPLAGGKWPHVRLGDSDRLKIGGLTYAMGNPFLLATDFKPTMTIGIVSGLHRYQGGTGPNQRVLSYPDCIQVDTPINPGNSGGPLFDENGLLVGINGRITIRDRGRVNTGVGFAVSINQIKNFLPGLLAGEHTEHGTLDMNAWNLPDPNTGRGEGIFLQGMLADSVVADAGLQLGDKITSFNGGPLRWTNDLARWVGVLPAGYEVTLGYRRFDERTRSYLEERVVSLRLAPIDTGSKHDKHPNVPDWNERPDFEALRAAEAAKDKKEGKKEKEEEQAEPLQEGERGKPVPMPGTGRRWEDLPQPYRKILPREWKDKKLPPEWWKRLPPDWRKRVPKDSWKKLPEIPKDEAKEKKRDLDREEALFRYMDGVMAEFRGKLAGALAGVDAGDRTLRVQVERVAGGERIEFQRTWVATGDDLRVTERGKTTTLSAAEAGSDLKSSLRRERDMNPLLQPQRLVDQLKDAYLEGGVFIGNRVGYVVAIRGPGRRAVFLDAEGLFPIGYRYRSFADGGIREVQFREFERLADRLYPKQAEVRLRGKTVEHWTFAPAQDRVGFVSMHERGLPVPRADVQTRIEPLFKSVVKIHGASGLRGIPGYGTGLVVSSRGHVLTWTHVSLLQGRCRIVFEDGSVHEYVRHREHPDLGVTILKPAGDLDPQKVPFVPLELPAEKTTYEAGTPVLSVGNSFKLAEFAERVSVTFGVVVSTVRSDLRLNLRKFPFKGDVLIVDAPSNWGTQGGGLFTLDGKLIGLLTTLAESAETNTQLSLAIPAYELAAFVAQATGRRKEAVDIASKRARERRAKPPVYTGIQLFEAARTLSPPAYIDRVLPRSPAAKARLRPDDLIVRVNEFPIRTCAEFRRALRNFGPGDEVDLTYKRGSRVRKVGLTLEAKR